MKERNSKSFRVGKGRPSTFSIVFLVAVFAFVVGIVLGAGYEFFLK